MDLSTVPIRLSESARSRWREHVDRWFADVANVPEELHEDDEGPTLRSLQQMWSRFRNGYGDAVVSMLEQRAASLSALSGVSADHIRAVFEELCRPPPSVGERTLPAMLPWLGGRKPDAGLIAELASARGSGPRVWEATGRGAPDALNVAGWVALRKATVPTLRLAWRVDGADASLEAALQSALVAAELERDTVGDAGNPDVVLRLKALPLDVVAVEEWAKAARQSGALNEEQVQRVRDVLIDPWHITGALFPEALRRPDALLVLVEEIIAGRLTQVDAARAQRAWTDRRLRLAVERVASPEHRARIERGWPGLMRRWIEEAGGVDVPMSGRDVERLIGDLVEGKAPPDDEVLRRVGEALVRPNPAVVGELLRELGLPVARMELRRALEEAGMLKGADGGLVPHDPDLAREAAARALTPFDCDPVLIHPDGQKSYTLAVLLSEDLTPWLEHAVSRTGWLRGVATRSALMAMALRPHDGPTALVIRVWATAVWCAVHAVEEHYDPPAEDFLFADQRWAPACSRALVERLPILKGPDPHAVLRALVPADAVADAQAWRGLPDEWTASLPDLEHWERPLFGQSLDRAGPRPAWRDTPSVWTALWMLCPWQMPMWTHHPAAVGWSSEPPHDIALGQARAGDADLRRFCVAPQLNCGVLMKWMADMQATVEERVAWALELNMEPTARLALARELLTLAADGSRAVPVDRLAALLAPVNDASRRWMLFWLGERQESGFGRHRLAPDARDLLGPTEGSSMQLPLLSPEVAVALAAAVGDSLVLRAWCDAPLRAMEKVKAAPLFLGDELHPDPRGSAASEAIELKDKAVLARAWALRHLSLLALGDVDALRESVVRGPMVIPHVEAARTIAVHRKLKSMLSWHISVMKEGWRPGPFFGAGAAPLPEEEGRALLGLMDTDGLGLRGRVADAFGVSPDAVQAVLDLAEAHPGLRLRTIAPTLEALWRARDRPQVWETLRALDAPYWPGELSTIEPHSLVEERLAALARRRDAATIEWLWEQLNTNLPPAIGRRRDLGGEVDPAVSDADVVAAEAGRWDPFGRMRFTERTEMAPDLADALWDRLDSAQRVQVLSAFDTRMALPPVWMERARREMAGRALVRFATDFGTSEDQVDAWASRLRGVADPRTRLGFGFPRGRPWTALDEADAGEVIRRAEAEPEWTDAIRDELLDPLAPAIAAAPRDVADGWLVRIWPRLQAFLAGTERTADGQRRISREFENRLIELHRAGSIADLAPLVDPAARPWEAGLPGMPVAELAMIALDDTSDAGARRRAAFEELARRDRDATCGDVFEEPLRQRRRAAVPTDPRVTAVWAYVARRRPAKVLEWVESAARQFPRQRRDLGAWAMCLAELAPPGAAATAELRRRGLEWLSVQEAAPL